MKGRKVKKMKAEWMSIEKFLETEGQYRKIKRDELERICQKYDVVKISKGWVGSKKNKTVPNLYNRNMHEDAPKIGRYFDHLYSLKTRDGKTLWCSCPYASESNESLKELFRQNYIKCEVHNGFYADRTIIMEQEDLILACYGYVVGDSWMNNKRWAVWKYSTLLSKNAKKIKTFKTRQEAELFLHDINVKRKAFSGEW